MSVHAEVKGDNTKQRDSNQRATERAREAIRKLAGALEHSVAEMMGTASSYGDRLASHQTAIEDGSSPHTDQDFGGVLLNELAAMQKSNDAYRAELEEANARIAEQKQKLQELQEEAYLDFLTKIPNRRALEKQMREEMYRSERYNHPLSLAFVDIDDFKNINDTHGHSVGDRILRGLVLKMQSAVRRSDFLSRYGGEEFAILLPATSVDLAAKVAEKLRKQIEFSIFRTEELKVQLTISIGVGQFQPGKEDIEQFVSRVDAAMYSAKSSGKNRVVQAQSQPA